MIESRAPVEPICITYQGENGLVTTPEQYATWTDWSRTSEEALAVNIFLLSLCSALVLVYIYFSLKYSGGYSHAWTWGTAFLAVLAAPLVVFVVFAGILKIVDVSFGGQLFSVVFVGLILATMKEYRQAAAPFVASGFFAVALIDMVHETTTMWMLLSGLVWGIPLIMALRFCFNQGKSQETFVEI